MTRDEIDVMWQQALHQSVQDGEQFTRYRFAALVAAEHGKAKIRIAELEEEVKRYMAAFELAYQQAMTNGEAANKAERKLAVARDELLRCKRIMLHECGIGLVNEVVLAQIGGE